MGKECKAVKQDTGLALEGKVGKEHEDDGQTDRAQLHVTAQPYVTAQPHVTGHATMAQERESEEL